jgi:hypothetical protein
MATVWSWLRIKLLSIAAEVASADNQGARDIPVELDLRSVVTRGSTASFILANAFDCLDDLATRAIALLRRAGGATRSGVLTGAALRVDESG